VIIKHDRRACLRDKADLAALRQRRAASSPPYCA
jgi:hypothetical protein